MTLDDIAFLKGTLPYAIAQQVKFVDVLKTMSSTTIEQGHDVRNPNDPSLFTENEKTTLYERVYAPLEKELLKQAQALSDARVAEGLDPVRLLSDTSTTAFYFSKNQLRSAEEGEPTYELRLNLHLQAIAYALPEEKSRSSPGFRNNRG